MLSLFAGAVLLSLIHAAIPNHWMPLVLLARSEKWSDGRALVVTLITGLAHSASTVLLGVLIGGIGYSLSQEYVIVRTYLGPLLLIFMGIVYFSLDLHHSHDEHLPSRRGVRGRSGAMVVIILTLTMFFSPCLEIESYFFSAGSYGWSAIWLVAAIYPVLSVATMVLLVFLGRRSLIHWNLTFLDRHEKKITGFTLIVLGILAYL